MEKMKYSLACDTWNKEEYDAIQEVVDSGKFSMGEKVKELEEMFAKYFNVKYCVMSNSGSSANLLAIAALVYSNRLQQGDEVIVPAVSWSTTYHPLQQYGLKVKFVDIDLDTLNYDLIALSKAISTKTKMIMVVNLLGNNNDFNYIRKLCEDNNIFFIEDNCESMGSQFNNKYSGTFGLLGTFSSFYSHHIATMEGGYTVTNNKELYDIMLSVRAHGWTRNLDFNSKIYTKNKDSFYEQFNFILPGYNLRPLEIEAAIAIKQLSKLNDIIIARRNNAKDFIDKMSKLKGIKVQKEIDNSSWFGFSIVLIDELEGKRDLFIKRLTSSGIEVRPIVAGNFTKNPVIKYYDYEIFGNLVNADYIHQNGFFVGNNGKNLLSEISWLFSVLSEIIKETMNGKE
jgi:CDP-6-deoxy-D-xylo-4-hexulose-3-dehydrase